MKNLSNIVKIALHILGGLLLCTFLKGVALASDPGTPLPEPAQKEKFFDPERFSFIDFTDPVKTVVQPHLSVSHDAREEDAGLGLIQTSEKFHGEAGGRLNLLGDISLTTFAKIPVYAKETVGSQNSPEVVTNSEIFKSHGRFSWRSELAIPVKKGIDFNLFYDNSTIGRIDKPGVEEREEKFGTRFIFKFE